ncbi:hypothetical protein L596_026456 [Steinernema carpocapsae]|uniref:Uncharacterized protein n=1 Tax=Steinernema carpocapsae TaxID=34508 RepID=A0A4U5M1G8_STECR|nr:hypothetical protein L596_026456 [Steinernema carpocapsae]
MSTECTVMVVNVVLNPKPFTILLPPSSNLFDAITPLYEKLKLKYKTVIKINDQKGTESVTILTKGQRQLLR